MTTTSSAETETETEDIAQGLGIDTSDEQAEAGRANEKGTVSGSHRRRVNVIGKETSIDNGMTTTAAEADVGTIETRTTNMTSEEEIAVGPEIGTGEGKVRRAMLNWYCIANADNSTLPGQDGASLSPRPRRARSPSPRSRRRSRSPARHRRTDQKDIPMRTVESGSPPDAHDRPELSGSALDTTHSDKDAGDEGDGMDEQMKAMLGFGGFGTTKQKKIVGNDVYAVRKEKKTEYRQYMSVMLFPETKTLRMLLCNFTNIFWHRNRLGGFNRPLSPS